MKNVTWLASPNVITEAQRAIAGVVAAADQAGQYLDDAARIQVRRSIDEATIILHNSRATILSKMPRRSPTPKDQGIPHPIL